VNKITQSAKHSTVALFIRVTTFCILFVSGLLLFHLRHILWDLRGIGVLTLDPDVILHFIAGMLMSIAISSILGGHLNSRIQRFTETVKYLTKSTGIATVSASLLVAIAWEIFEYTQASVPSNLLVTTEHNATFAFRGWREAAKDIAVTTLGACIMYLVLWLSEMSANVFRNVLRTFSITDIDQKKSVSKFL